MNSKQLKQILESPITKAAKGRFMSIEELEQIKTQLEAWEEDLQKQLGCPLEVVLKKIQELMIEDWNEVHCLQYDEDKKLWYIISYSVWEDEFYPSNIYYLKDYQKIWWLKGEKPNE